MRCRLAGWIVVVAMVVSTSRGRAEAPAVGVTLDVPALSEYVWRGQVLNDEAVVQPSATVVKGGFSLNTWASFNLTDRVSEDAMQFTEVDLTVSYSRAIGRVTVAAGLIEYLFPQTTLGDAAAPGTREAFVSVSGTGLPVVPALAAYYDFDEVDGVYAVFSLAYSAGVCARTTATLSASIAYAGSDYNAFYFGVDGSAWNDATASLAVAVKATDRLTVTPAIQYVALVDSDIEAAAGAVYRDDHGLVGSLKASYVF